MKGGETNVDGDCFISPIQVDITDSQLNLPDSSYFRIVLYLFELRFLPIVFHSDRVFLFPISGDRASVSNRLTIDCVSPSAEFVASSFGVLRLCSAVYAFVRFDQS
ncbi:unnamed protein product [Brassica napus]|uniref:(rape) hypothetical protein n=1 Tax=Brassica napus TaxID=3708 RepID=A0A816V7M6_BRANA|nr:unnamed protein product [Brassica napus]